MLNKTWFVEVNYQVAEPFTVDKKNKNQESPVEKLYLKNIESVKLI